jgi:hypothetical protein
MGLLFLQRHFLNVLNLATWTFAIAMNENEMPVSAAVKSAGSLMTAN